MNPLLTIIVPVYNREGLITRTLDSIASARQGTLSLMVVDNNSSDRTRAVCEEWAERHRSPVFRIDVFEELRPGAPAARNLGLRHVETPYVYFFDSDDLFSADFLTDMQGLLAAPSLSPDLLFVPVSMRDGSQLQTRDYKRSEKPCVPSPWSSGRNGYGASVAGMKASPSGRTGNWGCGFCCIDHKFFGQQRSHIMKYCCMRPVSQGLRHRPAGQLRSRPCRLSVEKSVKHHP